MLEHVDRRIVAPKVTGVVSLPQCGAVVLVVSSGVDVGARGEFWLPTLTVVIPMCRSPQIFREPKRLSFEVRGWSFNFLSSQM